MKLSLCKLLWPSACRPTLTHDALSLTPLNNVSLSGHWAIVEQTNTGPVLLSARLQQHGASVTGEMQCKFAALAPIEINGVLLGDRLVATWCRPHPHGMGSGSLDLRVTANGARLNGEGTWYTSKIAPPEQHTLHWERAKFTNPYDSPQEEPTSIAKSAWQYVYDPLIDHWVLTTLFAVAVVGAILTGLSTACVSR